MVQTAVQRLAAPPMQREHRLLAVRIAGAAFDGSFALRSAALETVVEEWQTIRKALEETRAGLVDALYRAVPQAPDTATRRQILELKRNVFNGRSFDGLPEALPVSLQELWREYTSLARRQSEILEEHRKRVFDEARDGIDQLLRDQRFLLGCGYASPDLREALGHGSGRPQADDGRGREAGLQDFNRLERGVYSYAARFISKANPYHLFGRICLPRETGIGDCQHEIVLDLKTIFNLEERLLPRTRDPQRVWLALSPFVRRGESYRFWVSARSDFELVSLAGNDLLRMVEDFFETCRERHGRPTGTRAEWRDHVLSRLPSGQQEAAERGLSALISRAIVTAYLVTDFGTFAPALAGLDDDLESAIESLQRLHLARPGAEELRRSTEALTAAERQLPEGTCQGYYVNSYRQVEVAEDRFLARVAEDLHELKPCFGLRNNFARHDHVIRSFICDYLSQRKQPSIPYLELLAHFLRHRRTIIPRYQPEVHRSPAEQQQIESWYSRLAAQQGELTPAQLTDLAAVSWARADRALCFNGPLDFADGKYYVTNVFAGDGRYLSRYLPGRHRGSGHRPAAAEDILDVELAVPLRLNLNYAAPGLDTGCGFEARYAHRYRHWLDPSEILVERHDQEVIYRHAGNRQRLRTHFRGLQLSQYLPPEYQLLMVGSADVYVNPFRRLEVPEKGTLEHDPALWYGTVCLRREGWRLGAELLGELPQRRDILRFSAALRAFLNERLAVAKTWYYRALGDDAKHKPRFLDLGSPLSTSVFRHFLKSIPADGALHLSAMEPPPAHLYREGDGSFVTELMIEV